MEYATQGLSTALTDVSRFAFDAAEGIGMRDPLRYPFSPSAARANSFDFINTGRNMRSARRHVPIPNAHRIPAIRTGTNEDSMKTRNAPISIRFARTIGLPVRNIVNHIAHPSSVAESAAGTAMPPSVWLRSATHWR